MREFINRYGVVVISGALVLAAIIWYFFGRSSVGPTGRMDMNWFIDENTGDVTVLSSKEIPPLMGKDGKLSVVGLVKISCNNGSSPFVAYYRKWSPQAKDKITELRAGPQTRQTDRQIQEWSSAGEMIRLPAAGSPWVQASGPEGQKILDSVDCKNGQTAIAINPP